MNIIKATAQFFSLNKYLRKSGKNPVGYFSWLHVTMAHPNKKKEHENIMKGNHFENIHPDSYFQEMKPKRKQ